MILAGDLTISKLPVIRMRCINVPMVIPGKQAVTIPERDGSFTIYINASGETPLESLNVQYNLGRELAHILCGHYTDSERSELEKEWETKKYQWPLLQAYQSGKIPVKTE